MKKLLGSWMFIGFMLLIDFYVFQSLRVVTSSFPIKVKWAVHIFYWSFTVVAVIIFLTLPYIQFNHLPGFIRNYVFAFVVGFFIAKVVAALFFLLDDLRRVLQWTGGKAISMVSDSPSDHSVGITRSIFLSWLGVSVGGGLFGSLVYGMGNKYKYKVEKVKLNFANLPDAFRGLKIVHISDIHSGSLEDKRAVELGVQKIIDHQPDIIFFTGDIVNNLSSELEGFIDIFSKIKAPMGVYSILGNHDYGDYYQWKTKEDKIANLDRLKQIHAEMGWRLLLNENVSIDRDGQSISLIGIENWGAKANFSRYGDLKKAYEGSDRHPFKILLSHDPSHWEAEVCPHFKDIDLTLSGHTHGMQFGVEIPGFRWSPVQYVYKHWAGVYKKHHQHLYVNRGFGFLGYPGRVGILPEITFINLV